MALHHALAMLIRLLIVLCLPILLNAKCNYSSKTCQCRSKPTGNLCLRYSSGSPGKEKCESYLCDSGYVCDCEGSQLCKRVPCSEISGETYQVRGKEPKSEGEIVPCTKLHRTSCIVPSSSHDLLLEPTDTPTPTLEKNFTWSMPRSQYLSFIRSIKQYITKPPSLTPSPTIKHCVNDEQCDAGMACSCHGKCSKKISFEIKGIGDDHLLPMICGVGIGDETEHSTDESVWTYDGACDDLHLRVYNINGASGFVAAIRQNETKKWIPVRVSERGGGLNTSVKYMDNVSFLIEHKVNRSSWAQPKASEVHKTISKYQDFMKQYKAEFISKAHENKQPGFYFFRIVLPLCT